MLRITVKNAGDFTSELPQIKIGTPIFLDEPLGTFTFRSAKTNKFLFIAGGVGITPIRSLIEQLSVLKKDIVLLYSNKTTDIIFKQELDNLAKQYLFKLIYIVTEDTKYKGEKGRIDEEKIQRLVPDLKKRDVYLCGPVPMMEALLKSLKELGVKHNVIHYERFDL